MPQQPQPASSGALQHDRSSADLAGGEALLDIVSTCLDDAKAEDVVSIDLKGKTAIGDHMIIASGRSERHVGAIADQLARKLKEAGYGRARIEGLPACDWVLVDVGDVIVHVFRPEVRDFYKLEKMWQAPAVPDAGADEADAVEVADNDQGDRDPAV
ncbi:MAG: ribosome silencing factor [Pseudomonadota bacterium]